MTLSDLATVSGKGGLFKVLAPTKSGVILESIDEAKTKMIATSNHKLSLLNEISIYTTTKDGTVGLDEVLKKINKDFGDDLGVDANSDPAELKSFLKSVLPEYDENRVYVSDIKKLVKWYDVILKNVPEILTEVKEEKKSKEEKTATEEKPEKTEKAKAEKSKEVKKPKEEKSKSKKGKSK
jgi:Fe2+ transport system protein B